MSSNHLIRDMKFPWFSSSEKTNNSAEHTIQSKECESNQKNDSTLMFNDKKYNLNSLPSDAKDLISAMKVAQAQVQMHEDLVSVLVIARSAIAKKLKEKLRKIPPISSGN